MKKKLLILSMSLMLLLTLTATAFAETAHPNRVIDNEGILTSRQLSELTDMLDEISEQYSVDVAIYITPNFGGKKPMDYADDLFDYGGYGYNESRDGILLVFSRKQRKYWITTCGKAIDIFTDSRLDRIAESIEDYFSDDDWMGGCRSFAKYCKRYIESPDGTKLGWFLGLVISLVLGLIFALFMVMNMKSKLRPVRPQRSAVNYVKDDSLNINKAKDIFLYRTLTRVPRPKETSGSSTHTSSSGRSHGGRGGSF